MYIFAYISEISAGQVQVNFGPVFQQYFLIPVWRKSRIPGL